MVDNHQSVLIETHPLPPFIPPRAKLLMLGSFPPPRAKWKMDFYYPNIQNDMWRIFGLVFFDDKDYFINVDGKGFQEQRLRDFLIQKGVAISDAAHKIQRLQGNASDKFLQVIEPVNLEALLALLPQCETIVTTGEKATETLWHQLSVKSTRPKIGDFSETAYQGRRLCLYRLPSSSRAYPLALPKKAAIYANFFREMGLLANNKI